MTKEQLDRANVIRWDMNNLRNDITGERDQIARVINRSCYLPDDAKQAIMGIIGTELNIEDRIAELQKEFDAL
jgi:hypothetical protein